MGNRTKRERRIAKMQSGEMVSYDRAEYRADILPPPDEIERYEKLNPGTIKILLDTYMAQSEHRMKLENVVVTGDNKRANRGQIISAILSLLIRGIIRKSE